MKDFLTYFAMFSALTLLIWLFIFYYKLNLKKSKDEYSKSKLKTQKTETGGIDFVRCPLCSTPLAQGEDMTSRIFRPMDAPDQRMTILGCPHCYPKVQAGAKRVCPVCNKTVAVEDYLISRLFNKEKNKKHVIITGCTNCYGPKKKDSQTGAL